MHKIKSIIGSRSSKKVQDIIRSKGLDYYYEFNRDGTLKKQIFTYLLKNGYKDTNVIIYEYNKWNIDSYHVYEFSVVWLFI